MLDGHWLAVACHISERDGTCFQIGNVACVDTQAVVADHAHARQTHPRAIDGLAVADRGGDAAGVADHRKATGTEDRHTPVAGQAYRVDAQQRRIQRQIAVGYGAVAQAGGRHRLWPEDLAVWPHVLGVEPRLALVARRRDHGAKSHPHQTGFVIDATADARRGNRAVDPCRHGLDSTHHTGKLDRERSWAQWCSTGAEHILAGDVLTHGCHATGACDVVGRTCRPGSECHCAREIVDAAARNPAAGREFAQNTLTIVAPWLTACDSQQHRASHHLRVDSGHEPKRWPERKRFAMVAGRASTVVA